MQGHQIGGRCLAGRGMPGGAARLFVCHKPRGKVVPFSLRGRSWDKANPSKRGGSGMQGLQGQCCSCKACKASVVGGPGVLRGAWSDARASSGGQPRRAEAESAWAGPGGQKGRWRRARTCTPGLLPGDFSPHKAGQAWAVLNWKVWFWALRVKLVLAA